MEESATAVLLPVSDPDNRVTVGYVVADYLPQHSQRTRVSVTPPELFWRTAAAEISDPDDLADLAESAQRRSLPVHAERLERAALAAGRGTARSELAELLTPAGPARGSRAGLA
ncbi:hypothetical protein ACTMTJ_44680 [Phytohabitans sp. LJ34]|uniref:hypothetical protein n=1 Tax=Phytohabitans sp. LJ34 TaxID=3452217 RepID=UPI003F886451